jgi:hypothetical protein
MLFELFTPPEDFDVEAYDRQLEQAMKARMARIKADPIGSAVALLLESDRYQWREEFVECLRHADPEALKAALIAAEEQDWADYHARHPSPKRDD